MIRVGIVGATGYTALELIKILLRHPQASITCVTSRENVGDSIAKTHPQLTGRLDVNLESFSADVIADKADFVFCCLPHGASAATVMELRAKGVRVVDFSADYRLSSLTEYESWYGIDHPDKSTFGKVPYGLPELFREEIRGADLVANPGCFPTSAILPLAPLLAGKLVSENGIIVDSKTGVSGAGRKPNLAFHYPECNESLLAYKVANHRHQPEINDILNRRLSVQTECLFTPHLVPMDRGILSTIYADTAGSFTQAEIQGVLCDFYADEPFVRIVDELPATKNSSHSNFCDIAVRISHQKVILICCLDNLIKGASGAAVQNFNLMNGFEETTALI